MATWQYTIELIPRAKLVDSFGNVPPRISENTYEAVDWWSHRQPSGGYESFVASFIPPCSSWSEDVKRWGEEDGNIIKVVLEKQHVIEMTVRFDLRNVDGDFVRNVTDFAQRNDWIFLTPSMELIEPSIDNLKSLLMNSDAARFVEDPARYFEEIKESRRVLHTA